MYIWVLMVQGISAVEQMCGRDNVLNHLSVPAACFTHPEVCSLYTLHRLGNAPPRCECKYKYSSR